MSREDVTLPQACVDFIAENDRTSVVDKSYLEKSILFNLIAHIELEQALINCFAYLSILLCFLSAFLHFMKLS